jgi:putative membrane protein
MYYFDPINMVFHVLLWILIVWFIIWLIRGARAHRHHHMWCNGENCNHPMHGGSSAFGILRERFAKGEINKEEYEEKKKTLMGQ